MIDSPTIIQSIFSFCDFETKCYLFVLTKRINRVIKSSRARCAFFERCHGTRTRLLDKKIALRTRSRWLIDIVFKTAIHKFSQLNIKESSSKVIGRYIDEMINFNRCEENGLLPKRHCVFVPDEHYIMRILRRDDCEKYIYKLKQITNVSIIKFFTAIARYQKKGNIKNENVGFVRFICEYENFMKPEVQLFRYFLSWKKICKIIDYISSDVVHALDVTFKMYPSYYFEDKAEEQFIDWTREETKDIMENLLALDDNSMSYVDYRLLDYFVDNSPASVSELLLAEPGVL